MRGKYGEGKFTIVDKDIYELYGKKKWFVNAHGYVARKKNGTHQKLHRLIINASSDKLVDHINMNKLDNRRDNLRLCDLSENMRNRNKLMKKGNTSAYKGVKKSAKETWIASIKVNKKAITLGRYTSEIAAASCYNYWARIYHGEFANINRNINEMSKDQWELFRYKRKLYSEYRGVSFHKKLVKWSANLSKDKQNYFLGYFQTEIEAAIAYNTKAVEVGYPINILILEELKDE